MLGTNMMLKSLVEFAMQLATSEIEKQSRDPASPLSRGVVIAASLADSVARIAKLSEEHAVELSLVRLSLTRIERALRSLTDDDRGAIDSLERWILRAASGDAVITPKEQ